MNTEQKNKDFDYILQDPRPNTHQETLNNSILYSRLSQDFYLRTSTNYAQIFTRLPFEVFIDRMEEKKLNFIIKCDHFVCIYDRKRQKV